VIRTVSIVFIALCLFGASTAQAQRGPAKADTELVWSADGVVAGNTIKAALKVTLEKGLHTNSNTPLEKFLIPTALTLEVPEGVTVEQTVYPEHIEIITGGSPTPLAVYEEHFVIGVKLKVGPNVPAGEQIIKAKLRYQACDDRQCYAPKNVREEWRVPIVDSDTIIMPLHRELFASIAFEEDDPSTSQEEALVAEGNPETEFVEVQGNDLLAMLDDFEVLGTKAGVLKPDKFIEFIDDTEKGKKDDNPLAGKGPIAIMLFTLVGGFLLNLTPCVLPLVPINLAIIGAGAQAGTKSRGFALGGAYGLAMAVVYGILGVIVILTAGSFGTINASPWFNVFIAVLFIVLGLAMFDIIAIDFSKFQTKFNMVGKGKKGTFALAFGMGGITALLAGACVAPMLIQVIVFASDQYNKGVTYALALPFLLGVGMALPWPFAGGGMSFLPKPGAWMVRIKQGMGLFILGFAIYYAHLAYVAFESRSAQNDLGDLGPAEVLEDGWIGSFEQGLIQAKAEGKPVLVDMWATWCKNCFYMDKTTFKDEAVLDRLEGYVKVKYQTEDLDVSPAKEILTLFDGIGLPNYAIIKPK
jgi:cytochrome c biogenesis protein CcdA/DsbC/DsbD-like thiol-disulfide interchange protein/thiol-disulfide isomerase/thioredoxin